MHRIPMWALRAVQLVCIGFLLFAAAMAVSECSPVNVQVQNCQNELRDSSGVTYTGCKADGEGEASGTLRVNLDSPVPKAKQADPDDGRIEGRGPTPPAPELARMN